jgi:UDP-glucose 4-epimerase
VIERALADYSHAYGIGYAALRYFNASGAAADGSIGEDHDPETHLIPLILQVALGQRECVDVFGTDYPTPDGTCIRDTSVNNGSAAHPELREEELKLNLAPVRRRMVKEVIDVRQRRRKTIFTREVGRRRRSPELVANPAAAKRVLWEAKYKEVWLIIKPPGPAQIGFGDRRDRDLERKTAKNR